MELARLACKQASPAGPFLGPRALTEGVQKSKKNVTTLSGRVFRNFLGYSFFSRSDPHVVGNGDLVGVWPVLGLGHLEKSQAQSENRKTQCPSARGPETGGGKLPRCPGWLSATFSQFMFNRPNPHGRDNATYEDIGPFWPRTAVGT